MLEKQRSYDKGGACLQMLSVENPPSDPPCSPRDISLPLKNSAVSRDDEIGERANSDSHHKLALQGGVDLFKPGVDFSSLPKFSIRDYVYNSRTKNIEANWPFSQRNLQRCLKHGLTDPLPPFQPRDEIRNQPLERCVTPTPLPEKVGASTLDQRTFSEPGNHAVLSSTGDVPTDNTHIDSCKSSGEKVPVTAVHPQYCDIDSVPTTNTTTLSEPSASTAGPSLPSPKTRCTAENSGKKCRLIVKLGSTSDPKTADYIASNCTEAAMASKVCPVCRTFSSSSNTTLNAHIDQCLYVEPTAVCIPDSRLAKHRIKPRKTRSMVDICATAPPCTLEDLDRRNGTSWAVTSASPTQDPKIGEKEKSQRTLPIPPVDGDDAGAVYIDASGTKLRILSKFSDAPSSVLRAEEAPARPCTALKKSKQNKCISVNNKKSQFRKHHKYLKLAPPPQRSVSPRACKSEIHRLPQEGNTGDKKDREKKRPQTQLFKSQEQIKPTAAGSLRPWVCSKRSGLSKKVNNKDIHQLSECNVARDLLVENDQSHPRKSNAERISLAKSSSSSENPSFSPESSGGVDHLRSAPCVSGDKKHSPTSKRARSPLSGVQIGDGVDRHSDLVNKNVNQATEDSVHDSFTSLSNKKTKVQSQSQQLTNFNSSSECKAKLSWDCHKSSSEAMRFPGPKTSKLLVRQSSVHKSRTYVNKKYIPSKDPRGHFTSEIDEEVAESSSEEDQQYNFTCDDENEPRGVTDKVFFAGRMRSGKMSQWEESTMSKSFQSSSQSYYQDVGRKIVASVLSNDDLSENFDPRESAPRESRFHVNNACFNPSSMTAGRTTMMSVNESLDPQFCKLARPFDTHSNSPRSFRKYNLPSCREETSMDLGEQNLDHGMFSREDGNDMGAELHSKMDQASFFSEVEPIPIPGPPGSYLPSPRDMISEDFQGNSSLTTSRVQSSQDLQELVDGYSTDSPISATSTISNPNVAGSDLKCSDLLPPAEPLGGIQNIVSSGFLGGSVEPALQRAGLGLERSFLNGGSSRVEVIIPEEQPLSFKDDRKCCCSRKERIPQAFAALDYQNSELLRRRASLFMAKQTSCNLDVRTNNPTERPEMCSFRNNTSSGFEKVPSIKSATGLMPMNISPGTAVRFSSHGDSDSASPSAPSPILRLMGKNLMVVHKDEDPSFDDLKYNNEGSRRSHLTLGGNYKSRPVGSFPNYQPQNPSIGPGEQNGSCPIPSSRRSSSGTVGGWGCTSDSSASLLQWNPFMAPPAAAAAVHPLRSTLYYSPRLS